MSTNQKKVRTQKAKPVDQAKPVIRKDKRTDVAKVTVTRSITTVMKAAPQWNAPAIQTAQAAWNVAADAIEQNTKVISDLRGKLAAAEATQRANRHAWTVATRQMVSAVEVTCQGSPDAVHALGFDVQSHVSPGSQPAPSGVAAQPGTVGGEAVVSWQRGSARRGFLVQHATDVANPATMSPAIVSGKTKYTLEGAPSRSTVCFRVAAIDLNAPTGASPWSDWVTTTVR
jgi:hypothetical protein